MPHALQSIFAEVGLAIAPLRAIDTPEKAVAFFRQLGYEIPAGAFGNALPSLANQAGELVAAVGSLADADGEAAIAEGLVNVISGVRGTIDAIDQLHSQIQAAGAAGIPDIGDFPRRLTDFLVLDYFDHQKSDLHETLHFLGLIEHEPNPLPEQPTRLINWDRFGRFLTDPIRIANETYRWETDFEADKFLGRMEKMMRAFSLPGGIYPQPASAQEALGNTAAGSPELRFPILQKGLTPETYSQFGITFSPAEAQGDKKKGIALLPYLAGATKFDFGVCDRGELIFESTADLRGVGIVIRPPLNAEGLLSLTSDFHASVEVREKPSRSEENILIGSPGGSRLSIQGLGIKWFAQGQPDNLDLGFEAAADALRLVIAPGEGDGFLQEILSGLDVQAEAGFAFGMSLLSGFTFKGGFKLSAELPARVDLGPIRVDGLKLSLSPADDHVALEAGAVLRLNLGPLAVMVENVGLRSEVHFRPGNLGPADLDISFKPPNGVGLAVDAAVVVGGGYLSFDFQKQEYSGILQLEIVDKISVKAIGVLTTRMPDGRSGYSLVALIFTEGFAPIQLGFGFALTGIGGLLGINRTFDESALRAGLKNHVLDSVMFPKDPMRNAAQIISNINRVFPVSRGRHLFGPMVQIGWGTPPLITANVAVVFEIGARRRLLILAQVQAILPRRENDLVRLQMDAIGIVDFDQGTAALDATLTDSRLLKKFVLTGEMAMRLKWEGTPNFAMSVGGLHPAFNPPAGFPKLERIAINLSTGDNPRIRCEAYFALTSNTVQFGARAEIYASAAGFSIQGGIGFDVLIQFDPFYFVAEFYAQVQVKRGSTNLFKVRLEGTLAGPRPLHIKGKATFEILWWDVTIRVDKKLVEGEKPAGPEPIEVMPRLKEALGDGGNWTSELPGGQRQMVRLRTRTAGPSDVFLHPLGTLTVKQTVVPLNMDITRFGQAAPAGERRFTITGVRVGEGIEEPELVKDFFAPAQYIEMSDNEKLSRPSFEQMTAGVKIGTEAVRMTEERKDWVEVKGIEFETMIVDKEKKEVRRKDPKGPEGLYKLREEMLGKQAQYGAAGRSELRRSGTARYRVEKVKHRIAKEGWSIVGEESLREEAVEGMEEGAGGYAEAAEALRKLRERDPGRAAGLKIVRLSEVSLRFFASLRGKKYFNRRVFERFFPRKDAKDR